MKNKLKTIIIIISIIIIVLLAKLALAKYMTEVKGNASANVAHFSFTVSEQKSNSLTIDLATTRLPNDTGSIDSTAVAPGTKGALAFDINADVSDVSLKYDIDIDITNVPQNLIFYYDEAMKNAIYKNENNLNINGYFSSDLVDKHTTQMLYWYWPIETGLTQEQIDTNDEIDSDSMGDLITLNIKVTGQQIKKTPIENQYSVTLNANGGVINGYGNSELMTKMVTTNQYGELPETQKLGYIFKGWYTAEEDGEQILSDTLVNEDTTYYAQWIPKPYTLTINPNGGTYNSSTSTIQITQDCNTTLGLYTPTRDGYTFDGWNLSGSGKLERGIVSGDGFNYRHMVNYNKNEQYTNYTINLTNDTDNDFIYPNIKWPKYNYIPEHEYKLSAWIRINEFSGFWSGVIRHCAIDGDYRTIGIVTKNLTKSDDFLEYSLPRTFIGTEIALPYSSTLVPITPKMEIYFHLEKNSTGILDMDIKNISIYDVTDGKYVTEGVFNGYIYRYGSESATLTAKWIKNN